MDSNLPETSGAYARCAFPWWPPETGQVRPTGRPYRKSLLRRLGVRPKARWRDILSRNVGRFYAEKHTAPCLVIEGRRPDSNRTRGSGDPEQRALFVPGDGEAGPVGEPLRGQLDRVTVAENGLHDIGRQETEPQDPRQVRSADARFRGKFTRRFKSVFPLQHRGRPYMTMPLGEVAGVIGRLGKAPNRSGQNADAFHVESRGFAAGAGNGTEGRVIAHRRRCRQVPLRSSMTAPPTR